MTSRVFKAKRSGRCGLCGWPIAKGKPYCWFYGEQGVITHPKCLALWATGHGAKLTMSPTASSEVRERASRPPQQMEVEDADA